MPVGDSIVPKQKRTSFRVLLLVSILLIGLLGSGIWLAYKYSGNGIADKITDFWSWLDDPSEATNELLDPDRQQTRYQELHADLVKALESEQSERLLDYGRAKFRDQIVFSLSRAEEAFDDGDIDNALRILELSSDQWREAMSEIEAIYSESSNFDELQTVWFDEEQEKAFDNSSVLATGSMPVLNVNEDSSSVISTQFDEKTFANVIQSTPIDKQRTSGTISNSQLPPKIGQEKTSTPSQRGALDSSAATASQFEPIDSPDKTELKGINYLSDESQQISEAEALTPSTVDENLGEMTVGLTESAGAEVAALELQPENETAQSSADETKISQLNSTRDPDDSINLPETVSPTEMVVTATVEEKSTEQTGEQDETLSSEIAALELQPQTETTESAPDETLISLTDSNVSGEESKQLLKVASPTEKANTAIVKEKSIEQTVDLENSSGTEVAALIPQSATEIADPITDNSTRSKLDLSDDNGQLAKLQYENSDAELARMIPVLQNNQAIVPHNDSIVKRVLLNRQKAQEAYQEQDFNEAKRLIATALADAKTAAEQEHEYFKLNLSIAKEAYSKQNPETAKQAIERAVSLRPNSHEALYWQQQVEVLPKFLEAQQDAKSARSSGELEAEIDALERIVLYSSNADEAVHRITELKQEMRDRNFANTINRSLQALSDGDLEQAKRNLAQAQKQRPYSSDTANLQNQITEVERQQNISRHLAAAKNAWEKDDWENTLINYQQVLAIDPRLDEALRGHEFALKIITLQARIDEFLVKPHRLSSPKIAAAAKSAIKDASAFGIFSPALKLSTESLSSAILEWQTPVPVKIVSDGETDIGIRGVGKIGKTLERSIDLLPGTYVFEGKRQGYRSTLVEMVVENNIDDLMEVTVICSERS